MSLMYDALRELHSPDAMPAPAPRGRRRMPVALGAGVASMVIAGAWLVVGDAPSAHATPQGKTLAVVAARATPAPAPAPVPVPAMRERTYDAPPVSPRGTPTIADVAVPPRVEAPIDVKPASAPTSAPQAQPVVAPPRVVADAQPVAAADDAPQAAPSIAISMRDDIPRDSHEADPQAIARSVAELERAMRARDLPTARGHLDALAQMLPANSLTLLRMQAWVAHEGGEFEGAITAYREIARRVPGDRAASINLATLEAQHGDRDGARERLQALRSHGGDSPELAAALARVEGRAQ